MRSKNIALKSSILGKIYNAWINSFFFSLLTSAYNKIRKNRDSKIIRFFFGEGKIENYYRSSFLARIIDGVHSFILKICGVLLNLMRGSVVCGFIYKILKTSKIINFEFLFIAFNGVMFVVPHEYWNNLYGASATILFYIWFLFKTAHGDYKKTSPNLLGVGFIFFAISCIISVCFTTAFFDSVRILILFLTAFLDTFIIASVFSDKESLRHLLFGIYLSLIIVSLYGLAQRAFNLVDFNASFTDPVLNNGVPGRITSTLDNPNNLSAFIQLFLPISAAFAAGAKKEWRRIVLTLGLAVPVVALIMTYSRSGWISVAVASFIYLWYRNKKLIPLIIIFSVMLIPFLPESIIIRFSTIGNTTDTSANHRLLIWQGVGSMLIDKFRFVTGIGLGPDTFKNLYPAYAYGRGRAGAFQSQMLYMELFVEMGITGFISFLFMYFKLTGKLVRTGRKATDLSDRCIIGACVATMFAIAVSGFFEYIWFYQRIIFAYFIFLGIVFAVLQSNDGDKIKSFTSN